MSETNTVSPLRQRMIEDMAAAVHDRFRFSRSSITGERPTPLQSVQA
jgi:hypothetical protein